MKKIIRELTVIMTCLSLCLFAASTVAADSSGLVFDEYGLLNAEEKYELEEELADLEQEYEYEVALLITHDVRGGADYRQYAAQFMQENDIGAGDTHEGMCILHQPDSRNITIVFRGETQNHFSEGIQEEILDHCKKRLKEEDPVGGYQTVIRDMNNCLMRLQEGKKIRYLDIRDSPVWSGFLMDLLLSFAVMAIPTLLMTLYQLHKMKTRVQQSNANMYKAEGGLKLTEKRDMFLYHTVTRTPKPKENNDHNNPSGTFTSGGERFSGSSSKY